MSLRSKTYSLGIEAEELAAKYFELLGFSITARRYKTKYGELDLIVQNESEVVFVEVKGRKKSTQVDNIITSKQLMRNYAAAELFLSIFPEYQDYNCRFDLIIVAHGRIIQHIRAITPMDF